MAHSGSIFIISAPSGAGKTSLVQNAIKKIDNIELSISYTTRNQRYSEINNKDYFFINQETFLQMENNGEFLESAKVFDNYYATSKKIVQNILANGKDIILEIDWQGAAQVKQQLVNLQINQLPIQCISIFILPPSVKELSDRLRSRGEDSLKVIQKRLNTAREEMKYYINYDYLVINDDFFHAIQDLITIIRAQRLVVARQKIVHASLINSLLV